MRYIQITLILITCLLCQKIIPCWDFKILKGNPKTATTIVISYELIYVKFILQRLFLSIQKKIGATES